MQIGILVPSDINSFIKAKKANSKRVRKIREHSLSMQAIRALASDIRASSRDMDIVLVSWFQKVT